MDIEISIEFKEQLDHERMKEFMRSHGWSCSMSADPMEIYIIIEQCDDDESIIDLLNQL